MASDRHKQCRLAHRARACIHRNSSIQCKTIHTGLCIRVKKGWTYEILTDSWGECDPELDELQGGPPPGEHLPTDVIVIPHDPDSYARKEL